jgi:probable HAF family extracellular repeat protein
MDTNSSFNIFQDLVPSLVPDLIPTSQGNYALEQAQVLPGVAAPIDNLGAGKSMFDLGALPGAVNPIDYFGAAKNITDFGNIIGAKSTAGIFGNGNDVIDLGNKDGVVNAGGGNNVVLGGSGNDNIFAGAGRDVIEAGEGNNQVFAGDGKNLVTTGAGRDNIVTGTGDDFVDAGDGNNNVVAGAGNNRILTGNGQDRIYTGAGNDVVYSGVGNDYINVGAGNNLINAGTGQDTVVLGSGKDRVILEAGEGSATIIGLSGADQLRLGESLLGKSLEFVVQNGDTLVKAGSDLLATLKGVNNGSAALVESGALNRYQATDLGSLSSNPNFSVNATAINDFGQIAGRYDTGATFENKNATTGAIQTTNVRQGFIWEDGKQTALTSTGLKKGQSDFGAADGTTVTLLTPNVNTISNRGEILGTADEVRQPVPKATDRALSWKDDGSGYKLSINDFGGVESYYFDTNSRNQIAGRNIVEEKDAAGVAQTFDRAISIENGKINRLADLGGNGGTAQNISDNGKTIVGYLDSDKALDDKEKYTAAVWKRDASGQFVLTDLGTFGSEQARLRDINSSGQIIGTRTSGIGSTAASDPFLLRDGQLTALGSLGGKTGTANGINAFGQVVGVSQDAKGANRAFVWNGGLQSDLNTLLSAPLTYNGAAVTLTTAVAGNNFGDIVATGTYLYKDAVGVEKTGTRSFVLKEVA